MWSGVMRWGNHLLKVDPSLRAAWRGLMDSSATSVTYQRRRPEVETHKDAFEHFYAKRKWEEVNNLMKIFYFKLFRYEFFKEDFNKYKVKLSIPFLHFFFLIMRIK